MNSKRCLIEIIKNNKLSLKENPFGINQFWPNSYIHLFYNHFCKRLYKTEKSPNILEVNQKNKLNIKLWKIFFKEPTIKNISLETINKKNFNEDLQYDFIIIDSKYVNKKIISILINLLKNNGVIIIENIGREQQKVIRIYFNFFSKNNLKIYDYRHCRFILKNSILVVESKNRRINIRKRLKSIFMLFKFLLSELCITLFLFPIKTMN
mgnify:CR=1 FL=1|tara:strand:- start:1359 stop:1985 length:627 start_codon:yes stop_codon:yes gene_type:complete